MNANRREVNYGKNVVIITVRNNQAFPCAGVVSISDFKPLLREGKLCTGYLF